MIYENQNAVKIRLTGLGNLSDAVTTLIKYKKPDGAEGSWTASVEDASSGIIFYNLLSTEEFTTGDWTVWASVTFSDGRVGIGDASKITVKAEGYTR
jgi:hypothetical protein